MNERLILIQTYSITLGRRAPTPRSSIGLGVAKKHALSPWYVITSTDEQRFPIDSIWEPKFWARLKPRYFQHRSTDYVTTTDIRMPWWDAVQQDQLQPDIVEVYCKQHGLTEPFQHEGSWWAFPNNAVIPVPVPIPTPQSRHSTPKMLTLSLWSFLGAAGASLIIHTLTHTLRAEYTLLFTTFAGMMGIIGFASLILLATPAIYILQPFQQSEPISKGRATVLILAALLWLSLAAFALPTAFMTAFAMQTLQLNDAFSVTIMSGIFGSVGGITGLIAILTLYSPIQKRLQRPS